jgi:2-isopropylmalate synthase
MVKYARNFCADVEFSAEDATRSDWDFLKTILHDVIEAGATTVNIPDTVGYTTPEEMYSLIKYIKDNVSNIDKAVIAVHCHNDLGLAVANTLAGIKAGAGQVECTVNGLGERAGNAALEEIVMGLKTRESYYHAETRINTTNIYTTSRLIYNIIGQTAPINKPVIGKNAFLHESGIHQHGVLNEKLTYEIMTPESIGILQNKMVLGKHSGKHAFTDRLNELGYKLNPEDIETLFAEFKDLCDKKKNVSDKDIEALALNKEIEGIGVYKLESFEISSGNGKKATCVVKIRKEDEVLEDVCLGDGPVDAAYNAIDRITGVSCQLETYDIHAASDGKDALGEAIVKVLIDDELITGRGLSTDIIEASILAYINAVNKR